MMIANLLADLVVMINWGRLRKPSNATIECSTILLCSRKIYCDTIFDAL